MNHTANYNLPQWEKSDRILMDDFNSMCASLDAGLKDASDRANTAQSTATTAVNKKNYVTGSYTGNGANRTIILNFRPSFVIISGMQPSTSTTATAPLDHCYAMTAGKAMSGKITFTATGFTVANRDTYFYPNLTANGTTYDYIAFR